MQTFYCPYPEPATTPKKAEVPILQETRIQLLIPQVYLPAGRQETIDPDEKTP